MATIATSEALSALAAEGSPVVMSSDDLKARVYQALGENPASDLIIAAVEGVLYDGRVAVLVSAGADKVILHFSRPEPPLLN